MLFVSLFYYRSLDGLIYFYWHLQVSDKYDEFYNVIKKLSDRYKKDENWFHNIVNIF